MSPRSLTHLPVDWAFLGLTLALAVLAWAVPGNAPAGIATGATVTGGSGPVHVSQRLDRTKIHQGGDGLVRMEITLRADEMRRSIERVPTDVVVVLDKSGSMAGSKIDYARRATHALTDMIGPDDRFALVTYDDNARFTVAMSHPTGDMRRQWVYAIDQVGARGSTNMSAGIDLAIAELEAVKAPGRAARVILISDGLPNRGDATHEGLVSRARRAAQREFVLTSVGVGEDFNENLMAALADYGTGNYYYLQNGNSLAEVFGQEFDSARQTVASGVQVHIDLGPGVSLIDAGGYPITNSRGRATLAIGPLMGGQERSFWVTLKSANAQLGSVDLGALSADWTHDDKKQQFALRGRAAVDQVESEQAAQTGIDKDAWAEATVQEEYNKLRQEVSRDVQGGRKDEAQKKIRAYKAKVATTNAYVQSESVSDNLDDVDALYGEVEEAFDGAAPAQESKRNSLSKKQSADAWRGRRK